MARLPSATPRPCRECPWRRKAAPGYLGPYTAKEWIALAHSDEPIACHKTVQRTDANGEGSWNDPEIRQCRGAASYRANLCKLPRRKDVAIGPRDPDVFTSPMAFIEHHETEERDGGR